MTESQADEEEKPLTIGVDIGGTKTGLALLNRDGNILDYRKEPTEPDRGMDAVFDDVAEFVEESFSQDVLKKVHGIGVAVAGLVNRKTGFIYSAPNLSWVSINLKEELEKRMDFSVYPCNDVDAAAWGEWKKGAGTEADNVIAVFIGTGVGTGVIIKGQLLEGRNSSAAELGHIPVVPDGRECTCPHSGCIEAYAGGWAIGERAREAVEENLAAGQLLIELAGSEEEITAEHVAEAAGEGNKIAKQLIRETGRLLEIWAVGIVNAFNPECIVMGGSVVEGIPEFVPRIRNRIQQRAFSVFTKEIQVVTSTLKEEAVVIGAAGLAREQWSKNT